MNAVSMARRAWKFACRETTAIVSAKTMAAITVLLVATVVAFSRLSANAADAALQFWLLAIVAELAIILFGVAVVFTILLTVAVVDQLRTQVRR